MILGWTYAQIAITAAIFVGSALFSTGIVAWFLVAIRPDYFMADARGVQRRMGAVSLALYMAGKNLLGLFLVIAGVLMALPGVPGQGLLTIFVGILLLDIPGKRRFELKIIRRKRVLRTVNRLRRRFNKPPLLVAPPDAAPADAAHHADMAEP